MRSLLPLAGLSLFAVAGCDPDVRTFERDDVVIHHLIVGIGNVWALQGDGGTVLVDLSEKGDLDEIERGLAFKDLSLDAVTLVVLTHGHLDHLGPAAELQGEINAPIALGADDVEFATSGFSEPPESQIFEADLVRPLLDKSYPAFTPDLLLGSELDLAEFGVPGRVVATPGHSKGSVSVVLQSGDVFVGDLARGTDESGSDRQGRATTHYFSADPKADVRALEGLLVDGGAAFYPGHGPWFDADSLEGFLVDRKEELGVSSY
ncbi:MAG: MBL fold metallo-hydrolase [Deltaproteobacteria bacterium]|nr:MBL fold metallo-hydrolase [Deltaproteobacteria bacterium]